MTSAGVVGRLHHWSKFQDASLAYDADMMYAVRDLREGGGQAGGIARGCLVRLHNPPCVDPFHTYPLA